MRADGVRIAESPTVNIQTIYRREKLRTCGSPSRSGAEARWRRTSRAAPCPERMRGGRCAPALGSKAAKWILRRRAVRPPRFHRGRFELCWERGAWRHRLWPPPPPPPPFQRPPRPAAWKGLRGGGAGAGFSVCVRNTRAGDRRAGRGADGQGGGQMSAGTLTGPRCRAGGAGAWLASMSSAARTSPRHPSLPAPPRHFLALRAIPAAHRPAGSWMQTTVSGAAATTGARPPREQRPLLPADWLGFGRGAAVRHAGYLLGRLVGSLRAWTRAAARPLSTRASLSAAGPSAAAARVGAERCKAERGGPWGGPWGGGARIMMKSAADAWVLM